jgi:hypothetical protein
MMTGNWVPGPSHSTSLRPCINSSLGADDGTISECTI